MGKWLSKKNNEIIKKSVENVNSLPSAKHKQKSNEIEKKFIELRSEQRKI